MMQNLSEKTYEMNEYLSHLEYNPDDIIALKGTEVKNFHRKSGKFEDDKFIVTTRKKCSASVNYDIAVQNNTKHIIYPGALLKGDKNIVKGYPTALGFEKSDCKITVDLTGPFQYTTTVKREYGAVSSAINSILHKWLDDGSYVLSSNLTYRQDIVTCTQDLSVAFGIDAEAFENQVHAKIDDLKKEGKSSYLVHFRQIFYNVSVKNPDYPADVFTDEVEFNDEFKQEINAKTPPCYVQNVSYGREIYLLCTSTLSSNKLKAHLDASFKVKDKKIDAKFDAEHEKINKQIQCQLVVVGGRMKSICGTFDEKIVKQVEEYINSGYDLRKDNPAEPLAYTIAFLKDNAITRISGTTEYILEDIAEYTTGTLKIVHNGAYVARFKIGWQEINFDENDNEIVTDKYWDQNGKELTVGFKEVIRLPANATKINVCAEAVTLLGKKWHKFCDCQLCLLNERTVEICGTTFNPYYHLRPDDSIKAALPATDWDVYRGVFRYKGMQFEKSSLPCLIQISMRNLKDCSEGDNLEELWNLYWRRYNECAPDVEDLPFYLNRTFELNTKNCIFIPLKFSTEAESSCAAAIITEDFLASQRPAGLIMGADDAELFYLTPQGEFIHMVPSAQAEAVCEDITPMRAVSIPLGDGKYGVAVEYSNGENTVTAAKDFAMIIM